VCLFCSKEAFKSSEIIFLSSALLINENGEKRDRVLVLLPNCLVVLAQNQANDEYDFEFKIPFVSSLSDGSSISILQIRRVVNVDTINSYGENMLSSLVNTHCFELIGPRMYSSFTNSNVANSVQLNRLLVSCPTQFDLKMWVDSVSGILGSIRPAPTATTNGKNSASNLATKPNVSVLVKQESNLSLNRPINTSNGKLNNSTSSNGHNGSAVAAANNGNGAAQRVNTVKTYSFRPHPPLIPHFQLPNDLPQNTSLDGTSTLKRFMYKKPKLTEPYGKCN
jgi:hypothetical protein